MDTEKRRIFEETLQNGAAAIGVTLTAEQMQACVLYTEHLLAVNEHTNLTRITDPAAVAIKHFVDSLTLLTVLPALPPGATFADVGTGAGFPGVVVKIMRPDLRLILLDSLAKRLSFLRDVSTTLGLSDVDYIHTRAEDAGRDPACRDAYDVVTARAVASLPILLEWCGPLVRVGGHFIAMKSESADTELAASGEAARLLQLRLVRDESLVLPPLTTHDEPARRRLLVYEKMRPTPPRYPRRPSEIKSKPL